MLLKWEMPYGCLVILQQAIEPTWNQSSIGHYIVVSSTNEEHPTFLASSRLGSKALYNSNTLDC